MDIGQKQAFKPADEFSEASVKPKETKPKAKPKPPGAVSVFHGIQGGSYQIEGMTVAEVREYLSDILQIPEEAVAVIDGEAVEDEDFKITGDVKALYFVKEAAVKGLGETIAITDDGVDVAMNSDWKFKASLSDMQLVLGSKSVTGDRQQPLPYGCKWHMTLGDKQVMVLQLEPSVRLLKASVGMPGTPGYKKDYKKYVVSLPYVILKVSIHKTRITEKCELFYSNKPLANIDDRLYLPNLLNISPGCYGCEAWLCTQYVMPELANMGATDNIGKSIEILVQHLWGAGYNRSSEGNEGESCFGRYCEQGSDTRVKSFTEWQKATKANPRFIEEVEWLPSLTVRQVCMKYLGEGSSLNASTIASELAKKSSKSPVKTA